MTTDEGQRHVPAAPHSIAETLLDPLGLPGWNPLFRELRGRREPRVGEVYELVLSIGLRGSFSYTSQEANRVGMTWHVPGLREESSWTLRGVAGGTVVTHRLERTGSFAALIGHGIRGVADLRLERLAATLDGAGASTDHFRSTM